MDLERNTKISLYERLVEELLKKAPDEKLVKTLMNDLGIDYTDHSIDRLSAVLAYSPITPSKEGEPRDL
ncbi:MAG: hypothetical protein K2Q26_02380 [Bdellovibrionales bacterium]|nr:hypothetical protein [Bdellovibrionales bacterium]